jgi:hypothetical protein
MGERYEDFHINIGGGITFGPDVDEHLKGRHWDAVSRIARKWPKPEGEHIELCILYKYDGQIASEPIKAGAQRASYSRKYRDASIYIGIPMEMILLDDESYRRRHVEYIKDGISKILAHLEKRGVQVDSDGVLKRIQAILSEYESLSFPLVPSPAEARISEWYESRRRLEEGVSPAALNPFSKVSFYIYFKTKKGAVAYSHVLDKWGYACEISGEGRSWLCLASKEMTDANLLAAEEEKLGNLAAEMGGDMDGWDTG